MKIGFGELILILLIVFVLFGAGKLPKVMGDMGRGIRNLREGLKGEDAPQEIALEVKEQKSELK